MHSLLVRLALPLCLGVASSAQQFSELNGRGLPRQLDTTIVMAFGDLDGDGDPDLVSGGDTLFPGLPLSVDDNDGNGRFTSVSVMPSIRMRPGQVLLADFDGDGDLDVFVATRDFAINRLFTNDGNGAFQDATNALPNDLTDTRAAAAFDVDGDRDVDLVLGNDVDPDQVLLNDGSGRFTVSIAAPERASDLPRAMIPGDFDRDGDEDLFIANLNGENRFWRNDGAGQFSDATASALPNDADATLAAAAFDADGDGDLDLYVGNYEQADRVYRNDGSARFQEVVGALPGDATRVTGCVSIDVDGDADHDLVITDWGDSNRVYLNDGQASFTPRAVRADESFTNCLAAADVDGDGDMDFATGNGRSIYSPCRRRLFVNDGAGRFAHATASPWVGRDDETMAIDAGDLTGEGFADVVTANLVGDLVVWRNDGFGRLERGTASFPRGAVIESVLLIDVDGDDDLDLLTGERGPNRLFLNDGTGQFQNVSLTQLPLQSADTKQVISADVDGDGDPDLLYVNAGPSPRFAHANQLLLNDGSGTFTDASSGLPRDVEYSYGGTFGDVDGDGDVDLVVGNWTVTLPPDPVQSDRLYLNDGQGRFVRGVLPADVDATAAVLLLDVDGDADLDLVKAVSGGPDRLFVNDGSGAFTISAGLTTSFGPSQSVDAGDFDGDGDQDLVFGMFDRPNRLFENQGQGVFVDVSTTLLDQPRDVTTGIKFVDMDFDTDLDLVVANRGPQKDKLLLNLQRQVDTPNLAMVGRPFEIELHSRASGPQLGLVLAIYQLLPVPVFLNGIGWIRFDPAATGTIATVNVTPGQVSSLPLVVPQNPALVGLDIWFQAFVVSAGNVFDGGLSNLDHVVIDR